MTTTPNNLCIFLLGTLLFAGALSCVGIVSANWPSKVPFLDPTLAFLPEMLIRLPGASTAGISTNQIAGTLLLFVPLLVALGLSFFRYYTAIAVGFLAVACSLGILILLTQSRSGWFGAAVGVIFSLILLTMTTSSRMLRLLLFVALLVGSATVVVGLTSVDTATLERLWTEPPQDTVIGSLSTTLSRQEIWQWAIVAIRDFPFTGTGLGAFRAVVHRLYPIAIPVTYDIAHAHNVFLQIALDVGIIGLIAYLAMLWGAAVMCWRLMQRDDRLQVVVGQAFLVTLVGYHVYGLGDALALGSKTGIIFWMFLGIVTGAFVNCRDSETDNATKATQSDAISLLSNS